jgi:glycosyltransferase involved in cell wall biosynthesis
MTNVPVSVVIPARNAAAFVGEALQSVFEQTWIPQEVIVVDDGSTDATASEVSRFRDAVCLRQPSLGVAEARNTGLRRASMPFITFLDADDLWTPTKTEQQLAFLSTHPDIDFVSGQMVQFRRDDDGETLLSPPASANLLPLLMIRREAFWRVGPLAGHLRLAEQIDWWARAKDLGLRGDSIPSVVLKRRLHGSNLGRSIEKPMQAYLQTLHTIVKRRRGESS